MKTIKSLLILAAAAAASAAEAQVRAPSLTNNRRAGNASSAANAATSTTEVAQQLAKAERGKGGRPKLKFDNAPAELFLQIWSQVTHRTLLTSPDVPKVTMSLRSTDEENWTDEQYLQAIEQQLQLNGIGLIPVGERFALVVPFKTIGQQGIETFLDLPPGGRHPEEGRIVRQVLTPKHVSAEEAQKVVESFKRPDGQIQYLERTNSLLVTDTQDNVNRMIEILGFIDRPVPVQEEVQVCPIKHAKAEDIKKALEDFVSASREEDEKSRRTVSAPRTGNSVSGGMQPGVSIQRQLPGVTRPGGAETASSASSASPGDALVSDADRGMIRGKVQILADERSNQLIIVTRPSNMAFFKRIIDVLDIETAPEIAVEIIRLRYAQAETKDSNKGVADLLNELIDASSSTSKTSSDAGRAANNGAANTRNLTSNRPATQQTAAASVSESAKSKLGELRKENIKILADSRINAVMVMASPGDLAAIKEIIAAMDIPVAQVLIETVVMEISLDDQHETGVQWVKRVSGGNQYTDSYGGGGISKGAASAVDLSGLTTNVVANIGSIHGGGQYFGTISKLNLDFLIRATASDDRTKVLTSPVLMTQDNKEASIESTELKYLYNGMKYTGYSSSGSGYQADIKQEEIGLTIKVTPHINPDGSVVLEFEETFQNAEKEQTVKSSGTNGSDDTWPTPTTRKLSGNIAVSNNQTVILGGLVEQTKKTQTGGIPYLKDLPYIGKYLFGYTYTQDKRSELLVFLTPYVFMSSEEAQEEARRRKDYLDAAGVWNKGWSKSDLADVTDEEEMLRRERLRRDYEDRQIEAREQRTEAQRKHDRDMADRLKKSIDRKSEDLRRNREDYSEREIQSREEEIENERLMHAALLRAMVEEEEEETK